MSTIETTGKTIEDAVRSGLVRLGRMKDEVDIEVLEEPKSGFFGFGSNKLGSRFSQLMGIGETAGCYSSERTGSRH